MEDFLDCASGLYPVQSQKLLKEMSWIFAPYRDFRNTSDFAKRNPNHFQTVIESVTERIYLHLAGRGQQKELDTRFEILGKSKGWLIIKEIGANARLALNTNKFISVGENDKYTIGKRSVFIEPDFEELLQRLNKIESGWGGGNTIIGSPRNQTGSKLTIDELLEVI